ncbi:LAFE_0D02872g1_1 [Lachancea fermentati]|uniref:LAFE_0D02872g1_1 n=1 Tax=Lachancea fermentati TaxID=4955 RepID=A0A1G4MB51_LACFM|nr:LAFE_0D02872g1_1 [Lachancea fermentati]
MSPIKRRRTIKSCKYCYEHKLKCNKASPCDNCVRLKVEEQCIYGFNKGNPLPGKGHQGSTNDVKVAHTNRTVFKTKSYYPFFSNSINERVLSASDGDEEYHFKGKLKGNEITNFNKLEIEMMTMADIISLIPTNKASMYLIVDTYFASVDPILPILGQNDLSSTVEAVYLSLQNEVIAEIPQICLLFSVLFAVSYSNVAKGEIPDILLCRKYYSAFEVLLKEMNFPVKPSLEALQAFVITNFIIDPNMVDFLTESSMLIRVAQQLGLHKECFYQMSGKDQQSLRLLWHYLLYIEGSSSVVAGLPFLSSKRMYEAVHMASIDKSQHGSYIAFANGRFAINNFFRIIMTLGDLEKAPRKKVLSGVEKHLNRLYANISQICASIRSYNTSHGEYFASTLHIFVFRAHLRFRALLSEGYRTEQIIVSKQTNPTVKAFNVEEFLETKHSFDVLTIQLSLILLFYTLRRLIEQDCAVYDWYTRGSTVMQYLFVVIKDIYLFPSSNYAFINFPPELQNSASKDIIECLDTNPVFSKFVLIEELMKVLEIKLAPLWRGDDLYKFFLVRTIKEKVWKVHERLVRQNAFELETLRKCNLFQAGRVHIDLIKSLNFDEFMKQWEFDKTQFDMEKILMNWLSEF